MLTTTTLSLCLCCGCGGTAAAFVADRGERFGPPPRLVPFARADRCHLPSTRLPKSPLFSAAFGAASETSNRTSTPSGKEMALQLIEENSMPPSNACVDDGPPGSGRSGEASRPPGRYDEDPGTPLESEFANLMSTFLTYSERDIQSLTSASARYFPGDRDAEHKPRRPRRRSREEGVRYRVLYSGVRAASLEPEVLRAFTVLFEDYLPVRLAGRKIYGHLKGVMEEAREGRRGEIAAARELCPGWDQGDLLEYARNVWDVLTDDALLLDDASEAEQSAEGGVISFSQVIRLGVDQALVKEDIVNDVHELEGIVRKVVCNEDIEPEGSHDQAQEESMEMAFPVFMKVLCRCATQNNVPKERYLSLLRSLEQKALDRRADGHGARDISTLLAANAVRSGSTDACRKRRKYSDRYEWYISRFRSWEGRFLGNDGTGTKERRLEILRGCFFGARNAEVVAALKVVYVDYAALRLAGDLIFRLMSKIAD